jgi:hypothetical protein
MRMLWGEVEGKGVTTTITTTTREETKASPRSFKNHPTKNEAKRERDGEAN